MLLVATVWLVRRPDLGRFATPDEHLWLGRSANFYHALAHGEPLRTIQSGHPGVPLTWIGAAAFALHYPDYAREAPGPLNVGRGDLEVLLRQRQRAPVGLLVGARVLLLAATTATLLALFLFASRALGPGTAFLGSLLLALDPFSTAHSRVFHLDALQAGLMLVSVCALLAATGPGGRRSDVWASGAAAGLAMLTRVPAVFLVPFSALLLALESRRRDPAVGWQGRTGRMLAGWGLSAGATVLLLWPGLWAAPLEATSRVVLPLLASAAGGHESATFFDGVALTGDPGPWYYPVTFLYRSTPVVLAGMALAALIGWGRSVSDRAPERRGVLMYLLLFGLLYGLFLTAGGKKADRYLLPVHGAFALVAAAGWHAAAGLLRRKASGRLLVVGPPMLLGVAVAGQAADLLGDRPYFLTHYNPVLQASLPAERVLPVGWGEGLDEAARYLDAKPNAESLRVVSWYGRGPFSFFFRGGTTDLGPRWSAEALEQVAAADYLVIYRHQWQRRLPNEEFLRLLRSRPPEHVVRLRGREYVWIYRVAGTGLELALRAVKPGLAATEAGSTR